MKFDLKSPCASCPFRSDIEPFLTTGRVREILGAITTEQRTFTCHKTTVPSDVDDPDDREKLDMAAPVFSDPLAMLVAHREDRKRRKKRRR